VESKGWQHHDLQLVVYFHRRGIVPGQHLLQLLLLNTARHDMLC
jgi:hypothetical protein